MAKGNMLQGQATGKVGDIVFMVRNGQQISRVYTASGGRSGDQASIAVRRQRVRFGAASNQYLLYRNIVRGMYRTGKQTRQSDYNYFVRENVDLLPYLTKEENAAGVKCVMPGTFSKGTLGNLIFSLVETEYEGSPHTVTVESQGFVPTEDQNWNSTVGSLKNQLKIAFPNARKVNFCVCRIIRTEVDLPSGSSYSHTLERGDVVFDLYEPDATIADTATIAQYFRQYGPATLQALFAGQSGLQFCTDDTLFTIEAVNGVDATILNDLYILVFATNDQVGDCYTSTLTAITGPSNEGGTSLYSTLRTDNHRQIAEDSYGYATGVMRTNIQQA